MRNSAPVNNMPPKAKAKKKPAEDPAPATRPRRTKTFRKLALAIATLAALSALTQKSRGAAKFRALGAARYQQHLADTNAASLSQSGSGLLGNWAAPGADSKFNASMASWRRGDGLGLSGRLAGTSHQHTLHGDVVRSKAFQEAAEGLAKDISTSRTLKPSEKLDAITVGEGFLRHVNPRRLKFTRPMKMLGAAAAILLALGGKSRLEGVVSRGLKSNKPFAQVYASHQGPGSFARGVDLGLGDVSASGAGLKKRRGEHNNELLGAGLPKKKLKGACRGGSCDHEEKYSDVLE